jgi:monothiol glutaredoxin
MYDLERDVQREIAQQVRDNKILIYMKGTPDMPMCGFSYATVQVFRSLGVPFTTVNVLDDPEIRQGIKVFSNWPTIPQVYINGEFIGGNDIIQELYQRQELQTLVAAALES